jgi:hypothetical protein
VEYTEQDVIDRLYVCNMYEGDLDTSIADLRMYLNINVRDRLHNWRRTGKSHTCLSAYVPRGSQLYTWCTFIDYLQYTEVLSYTTVARQLTWLPELLVWANTEYNLADVVTLDDICEQFMIPNVATFIACADTRTEQYADTMPYSLLRQMRTAKDNMLSGKARLRIAFTHDMLDFAELQFRASFMLRNNEQFTL